MSAIAEEAGVSPETIYATFGSKSAILRRLAFGNELEDKAEAGPVAVEPKGDE